MDKIKKLSTRVRELEIITSKKVNEVFAGNYKSSFRGHGLEVEDLRLYTEGDDIRHIDWITTAKQGRPYIKKYQETRELTTYLLVDVSASMNFGSKEKRKKDISQEIATTLLFSALKNNDKFGVIIFSDKIEKFIPARKGRSHFLKILRDIVAAFQKNQYKKTNLLEAINFLNKTIKKRAICFLLSDNLSIKSEKVMAIANQKHDLVYFGIFDNFEKGEFIPSLMELEDAESGEKMLYNFNSANLKKKFMHELHKQEKINDKILKNNKIDSLFISTQDNIYKKLSIFFKIRQAQK